MKGYSEKDLIRVAKKARESAYSPYSDITVGAALLTRDGRIYTGANIENASYGATVCAERVALYSAIHNGDKSLEAIAIVGAKRGEESRLPFVPCGICRQTMREFCGGDFKIILESEDGHTVYTLDDLLPHGFGKDLL